MSLQFFSSIFVVFVFILLQNFRSEMDMLCFIFITTAILLLNLYSFSTYFRPLSLNNLTILPKTNRPGSHSNLRFIFDFFFAATAFIFSLPALFIFALLIVLFDRRSPLFLQKRIGKEKKSFIIIKLQTLSPQSKKASPIGAFLRRYHIDEIPQLVNVLRGEMAIVGPRPELPEKIDLFKPQHQARFDVLPGITGYWQLSSHRSEPIAQWAELDILYLQDRSFLLDMAILTATPFLMGKERPSFPIEKESLTCQSG